MCSVFRVNLVENLHQFNHFADKFEQVPMYLMTFHGQESIRKVIAVRQQSLVVREPKLEFIGTVRTLCCASWN